MQQSVPLKLMGIGDLFIPSAYITQGFAGFTSLGVVVDAVDWPLRNLDELQGINLLIEQQGCEAYSLPEELLCRLENADILITQFCPINKAVIDRCKNLKAIGVLRGGYENVNLEYACQKAIALYNTPGRNADAVADFTVGGILCECRNIARGHGVVKAGGWKSPYPNRRNIPELPGKTVGLVGLGEIGLKVAKRLAGFDVRLLGYDPFAQPPLPYGIEQTGLEALLEQSDFVSLHARLTPESHHLINAHALAHMKPTAYLINTARSGLVDEVALFEALQAGRLAGAFLDVFESEPTHAGYPLITLENVTVTPHMAGGTRDAFVNSPLRLAAEMQGFLQGKSSRFLVNPQCLATVSQ